ncbi:MAG: glycosyltransferase family 9 protein [Gemmatimonadaceae bacterium]
MPERILIVKIAALGDAVMASTLVPAIRGWWPDAKVGWVAGTGIAPLVRLIEGVDDVIEVNDKLLLAGNWMSAVLETVRAWKHIGRGWDRVFVAHTDARYAILSRFSGAISTVRFAGANSRRPGHWYGGEYLRMVNATAGEAANVSSLAELNTALLPEPPAIDRMNGLVVVAPGGARNLLRDDSLRRWPIESWVATVTRLVAQQYTVVAIGERSDAVECEMCGYAGAINYCERTSLLSLMSLLQSADLLITHDSGPLHLAIALRRPVVALFGPTSPVEFVPHGANVTVLTRAHELACAPCYNGTAYAECSNNLCIARVPADAVVSAAERMLAGDGNELWNGVS